MFKVICVKNGQWEDVNRINDSSNWSLPSFGEVCTVKEVIYNGSYVLVEYEFCRQGVVQTFRARNFIPLSNIDETELVNTIKEVETVNN